MSVLGVACRENNRGLPPIVVGGKRVWAGADLRCAAGKSRALSGAYPLRALGLLQSVGAVAVGLMDWLCKTVFDIDTVSVLKRTSEAILYM